MGGELLLERRQRVRQKKRVEEEGYVSPDYVLPDGSVSEDIKRHLQ